MSTPTVTSAAPFFIVRDLPQALEFYRLKLGFDVMYEAPQGNPFFAIVVRGGAMLMLKCVDAPPLPNSERDADARWDAYFSTPDPDALASELTGRGVAFSAAPADTDDGLRGFEIKDPDGYVLFFGRPR